MEPTSSSSKRPRWHWIYFLLAGFDIGTVSLSLYLTHRLMSIYTGSVAVNQTWAERLSATAELGQLAAAVNAPGNDVFESQQIERESQRMAETLRQFSAGLTTLAADLRSDEDAARATMLNSDVKAVREAMNSMVIEGQLIFTALGRRENAAAGRHMAAMDRQLVSVNAALLRLREHIASAQKEHFAEQQARAASLQTFEYLIAAAIVIMVGGATFYGIKIARQVEEQGRERERSNLELEKRVRERTTDLVTANEALRTSEQSRARLLRQVMSAQEDERRRISRDLHDGIGQSLTSLLIGLRTLEGAESQETVHGRTAELRALVADTLEEVRRLARGLRPSVLDDLGLAAALERLTTDYSQAHGIAVALDLGESAGSRLPALVETALYRIVQEALTNTAKHAAAKNVNIALRHDPAAVQMTITDDGQGFDMTASSSRTGGHFGLSSIKERARLLSGTASVVSRTGQGTTITVRIPLTEVADGEDSRAVGG